MSGINQGSSKTVQNSPSNSGYMTRHKKLANSLIPGQPANLQGLTHTHTQPAAQGMVLAQDGRIVLTTDNGDSRFLMGVSPFYKGSNIAA